MTHVKLLLGVCLLGLALVLSAAAQDAAPPAGQTTVVVPEGAVPRVVRFTGVLQSVQGEPHTGVVGVTFALYKEQEGGAPLWLETQNVEVEAEGRYNVLLGATQSDGLPVEFFLSGEARWLGIQMKGQKEQRVLLVAVPYAFKAADAETLGGKPGSAYMLVPEEKATLPPGNQPANALGAIAPFYTATSDGFPSLISLTTSAPPLTVVSTQMVANLNADMLDGMHASAFGDITAVIPGTGLSNGGVMGDVTLNVNTAVIQARVTGTCPAGSSIQSVDEPGTVSCETDDGAAVAGTGMATTAARSDHTHEAAPLGQGNTGVGVNALAANAGASNTAVGAGALSFNTGGFGNTAVGRDALLSNTASNNTALGTFALDSNSVGSGNAALGFNALQSNTSGDNNTALGTNALALSIGANGNTAIGANALFNNMVNNNTAVGAFALDANTTGTGNTAVGLDALGANSTGVRNTAVGNSAVDANTIGSDNTALGFEALSAVINGGSNTAVGSNALAAITNSSSNTAVGNSSLRNSTGGGNTAVGSSALFASTTADNNTALGNQTLAAMTSGFENSAVGASALDANNFGSRNTAVGFNALGNTLNTNTSDNIALGWNAGVAVTSGSNNILVGNTGTSSDANTIRIGTQSGGAAHTATFIAGIRGVTTGSMDTLAVLIDANGQLGTMASTQRVKEDIGDMGEASERLRRLRPVVFRYKRPAADGSKPLQYGLIAEEVAEVMPELVVYDAEGQPQTVQYHVLPALLLNELQRQQFELQQQQTDLAALRQLVATQTAELAELKAALQTTLAKNR